MAHLDWLILLIDFFLIANLWSTDYKSGNFWIDWVCSLIALDWLILLIDSSCFTTSLIDWLYMQVDTFQLTDFIDWHFSIDWFYWLTHFNWLILLIDTFQLTDFIDWHFSIDWFYWLPHFNCLILLIDTFNWF